MIDLRAESTDALLRTFEPGTTLDDLERMYRTGVLDGDLLAVALELFVRAERMTGQDFRILPAHHDALARAWGLATRSAIDSR